VITSGKVLVNFIDSCISDPNDPDGRCPIIIVQGVTDVNDQSSGTTARQVLVDPANPSPQLIGSISSDDYTDDVVIIKFQTSETALFPAGLSIRRPSSSPTQGDVGKLYAIGFGETFPGSTPSPQLNYVPINPMDNHPCFTYLKDNDLFGPNSITFQNTFCVFGANPGVTGGLTDVCVLDAGGPIIRTTNIAAPLDDYEVVGIISLGSCSTTIPGIISYIHPVFDEFDQEDRPSNANPPNPRAFDGNFICGDGNPPKDSGSYEKCDPTPNLNDPGNVDISSCCNPWTCQLVKPGSYCVDPADRNGTFCKTAPICDRLGKCKSRNKPKARGNCNKDLDTPTRCNKGRCCSVPGATACTD